MDEIRIAVVGLGSRALRGWIPIIQKLRGYRITALCEEIPALQSRAYAQRPELQGIQMYSHYDQVLADPNVDAIALTVRSRLQGAMAAQGLEAGKHLHSEVPMAHTVEECWRIINAVQSSGKVYLLGEQTRYWGFVDAWQEIVQQGQIGKPTYCEGQYIGYYGTQWYFRDFETGEFCTVEDLPKMPNARPTWFMEMPPIHYLPHELSPMLKVLDDRVVEVTAMSTGPQSYSFPVIQQPDLQVALMKTEKDTILRMAAGFTQKVPSARGHHWYHVMGTRGSIEWKRAARELPKMWRADAQMFDVAEVDWRWERTDPHPEAKGSGHGDADVYPHINFRDAILDGKPLEFDVYKAVDTAAPAILAADSIALGSVPLKVPDFRKGRT